MLFYTCLKRKYCRERHLFVKLQEMTKQLLNIFSIIICAQIFISCRDNAAREAEIVENAEAKAMLAGIWLNEEEETVMFRIKGDTIYYPDTTTSPVKFKIVSDTMIITGKNESKYPIIRQTKNIFEFKNQNGENVKLVRSDNPTDSLLFVNIRPVALNQKQTIKRDTVVSYGEKKYHCYIQINPTQYKVYRTFTNAEGMEVENVYYDNIIHVSIFQGAGKMYSRDFKKAAFKGYVPEEMLTQMILSDIDLLSLDGVGFHYKAQLAIPDSPGCFIVNFTVAYDGRVSMHVS